MVLIITVKTVIPVTEYQNTFFKEFEEYVFLSLDMKPAIFPIFTFALNMETITWVPIKLETKLK